jgi:hypothetical protein
MKKRYYSGTSFLDLLFNCLLVFVLLFTLAVIKMNAEQRKDAIAPKAEFVIMVTWPDECPDDVDTWLEDPVGNVAWFRHKAVGMMHLDRDDLGKQNDTIELPDGTSTISPYNQEVSTIRGAIPGEWTLNVHMYRKRTEKPTPVSVSVQKLNPTVSIVVQKEIVMARDWEEVTIARFEMSAGAAVLNLDDTPKEIVGRFYSKQDRGGSSTPGGM